jgi:bla regulator protein BlaR1
VFQGSFQAGLPVPAAMTPFDLTLVRLLLAAAGSLAAGGAVWLVALLLRRHWPALAAQRSLWLLGQAAVAVVFAAMLLPKTERLRVVPVIELGESAAPSVSLPPVASTASASVALTPTTTPVTASPHAWLRDAGRAWLTLYLLGLGYALWRWWQAQRLLNALAAGGHPLAAPEHAVLPLPVPAPGAPAMIEVDLPIAPMLMGLIKPRLLLPRHLASFDPLQQQLIVEHELTHWRRHDLRWSAAALALQTLFWFNPFMYLLRARLGWAQEFGCDRDVLRGRPPADRKAYAAALVAQLQLQLRLQQYPAGMALAFGASAAMRAGGPISTLTPTLAARIGLIRTPGAMRSAWPRGIALGSVAVVTVANLALQPALGWRVADVPNQSQLLAPTWPTAAPALPAALDCLVMVDAATGATLVRAGTCDTRVTPASTFKIAISLMGFDSGVLQDAHTPYLPYQQRYKSANPAWRHGTDPAAWLRESVVWYSQQVTTRLGASSVRHYAQAFDYGNRDLASVAGVDDAVAVSELSPTLRISPLEQTAFLRKVVNRSLPLSAHAYDMTARLLKRDAPVNGWDVYGKTGTASVQRADGSTDRQQNIGWFVGWTVKEGRTVVFARLMQGPVQNYYAGAQTRDTFLRELAQRTL